jgi:hypothetical protein
MAKLVVAVGTAATLTLTAPAVEAHPEWDEFRSRRLADLERPPRALLIQDGLTPLLLDKVTERERALRKARKDWLKLDRAWERAQAPPPEPAPEPEAEPVVTGGPYAIPTHIVMCESGGDYSAENATSTASGAYQILDSSWAGYGGYYHAADAPPSVQDAKAAEMWAGGAGASHWAACL